MASTLILNECLISRLDNGGWVVVDINGRSNESDKPIAALTTTSDLLDYLNQALRK